MLWYFKYLISSFIVVALCLQKYCLAQTTTVRPYKFGFTIEEQQHRYEKRDERGIVMGEFGFITADGIYHVTVYATDEQGRFRILAMKNYPYESPPKTVEVMVKPKVTTTTTTTEKPVLARHNFYTEACSGCFLKNGNNKPKSLNGVDNKNVKSDIRPLSKVLPSTPTAVAKQPGSLGTQSKLASNNPAIKSPQVNPGSISKSNTPTGNTPPIMDIIVGKILPTLMSNTGKSTTNSKPSATPSSSSSPGSTKTLTPGSNSVSNSQSSNKANANPSSVAGDGDLYRFKYILDYHGHTETGKRNGNKEGNYFVIGDDDIERAIEYVAYENGYQPHIRWRKLNQNEIKSKENTLKDYEFVWFTQ